MLPLSSRLSEPGLEVALLYRTVGTGGGGVKYRPGLLVAGEEGALIRTTSGIEG
jgi:hypothetical protein